MYERDVILDDLRQNVMRISFTKVNGEHRIMKCTLRKDLLPATYISEETVERDFHKENKDVISAWDMEKGGWRSFRIDSVLYVEDINGNY